MEYDFIYNYVFLSEYSSEENDHCVVENTI